MEPEHNKQCRDTRQMARFPCNGVLHVTLLDGYFDCVLNHLLDHVHYTDITIPDKWREFIMDNYKLGPTNVSVRCFIELVMSDKLVQDLARDPSAN